jgi:hypothetical protein
MAPAVAAAGRYPQSAALAAPPEPGIRVKGRTPATASAGWSHHPTAATLLAQLRSRLVPAVFAAAAASPASPVVDFLGSGQERGRGEEPPLLHDVDPFVTEGSFVHTEIFCLTRAYLTMERDKKNNDMASGRNNKRMWYCSHDRRLQLKKSGFIASEYFAR